MRIGFTRDQCYIGICCFVVLELTLPRRSCYCASHVDHPVRNSNRLQQIQPIKLLVRSSHIAYVKLNYLSRAGRWRSHYEIDFESRTIQGRVLVNVHYYEQGNVRLVAGH
jgi:hypothetical protein